MRLFGFELPFFRKATDKALPLAPVSSRGGWHTILESFAGAFQRNVESSHHDVLAFSTVWACVTLIASDISKLWLKLVELEDGIWTETEVAAFSPILRKPNPYQTRVKFYEYWIISKLTTGNTYVLKERDNRNVVVAMHILDPQRVQVLVAPNGEVFYALSRDDLSGQHLEGVVVPASEIIHDLMVPLYHPLVGVSPIYACGLSALQGLKIQRQSEKFFANNSQPGGVLTAPGIISEATAQRVQANWEANFGGLQNAGKVAVLGDGLKFEPMAMTAVDAQLIEQLKLSAETICSCFHVPPHMVGVGPPPAYNNVQSLAIQYYSQALQALIENLEALLDEGLALPRPLGVEFDLDALFRMDTATQMKTAVDGVGGGIFTPNEGRAFFDLKPVPGGDSPMLQQQMYSLAALNERDQDQPFSKPVAGAPALPAATAPAAPPAEEANNKALPEGYVEALLLKFAAEDWTQLAA